MNATKIVDDVPSQFQSRLVYPDPFRPVGIEFDLPKDSLVSLKLYDDRGTEVATVLEKSQLCAGIHTVDVDVRKYPVTVFLYRLIAQSEGKTITDVKKMLLTK